MARAARAADVRVADDDGWGDIFSRVLVEKIESQLGIGHATILDEYPAVQAALARPSPADPRIAQRFELYVCGVELANGFAELTDPVEQRRRLEREMAEKARIYGERYPLDEDFLAALRADAAGLRHRAWPRPPGHAGDRRRAHRTGIMESAWMKSPSTIVRSVDELCDRALVPRERLDELAAVAARYAVAITPAMAELIDPADPHDPIARQFVPRRARA